ncbi:sensor histidine kinase [Variovorax ginsengisoli]|uniref:histidine kinase n=1 Tax=Variovorax ginsengisoli TaxID=363844 RepID=A0ABT9SF92_9BURK|nr:sensor histidine kinase [Variovorax ginsengisoli]MDP9903039.1 signal transduction histidine kinase [Variovorax ginsengisoli]
MQLANFLESAREDILDATVDFARTIPVLSKLDTKALRDHLPELLKVISADLRTPETRAESIQKSLGDAPPADVPTSAQTHGLLRAQLGLSVEQVVAEYRALRSSVLRLWTDSFPADDYPTGKAAANDILRFNEAIDQAVAESVEFYESERERWRHIFLAVLGRDLRGPLDAISLTVELMRKEAGGDSKRTAMLARGVKRLASLLDSLLEYSRSSLGVGMILARSHTDLGAACADELELLRAANPKAHIDYQVTGDTQGEFDASRVREALGNLVSNAVKHSDPSQPTVVCVQGDDQHVRISVDNAGEIPIEEIDMLFEPLYRRSTPSSEGAQHTHLGLGLFITRQIARAHDGEATGTCVANHVCFTIELPKAPGLPLSAPVSST